MKQLLFIFVLSVFSLMLYSFRGNGKGDYKHYYRDTIPVVARSNSSLYTQDSRVYPKLNQNIPTYSDTLYADTAHVNNNPSSALQIGNDYIGALIYTTSDNNLWVRKINGTSKYWSLTGNGSSSVILPSCGLGNNGFTTTGYLTYDSTGSGGAVFDVKGGPYALCCDHQARVLHDTVIVIQTPIDTVNPAYVGVFLGASGISLVRGTPSADPALPQSQDTCAIPLTYVQFAAGQTQPTFVTPTNPYIIYNENIQPQEWILDNVLNMMIDTADMTFPVIGTHDIKVTPTDPNTNFFELHTSTSINLNNYGALKLYVRSPLTTLRMFMTWYLDGQQQTVSQFVTLTGSNSGNYNIIVIPTSSFSILQGSTAQVNSLRINFTGTPATTYIDWIQLQSGIPLPNPPISGLQNIVVQPTFLLNTPVTINGTTATLTPTFNNQSSYTLIGNFTNASAPVTAGKIDLSTPITTGFLDVSRLNPSGSNGDFIGQTGGVIGFVTPITDTTFAGNFMVLRPIPNTKNDSLLFGYFKRDTSKLLFDTYASLNGHFLDFNQGNTDIFKLSSNGTNGFITVGGSRFEQTSGVSVAAANDLTVGNDGNFFVISGNTQINAITTTNWQSGSIIQLEFSGTPTVKNNTTGGAGTAPILLAGSTDYIASPNDVITLAYDGTNWHETARKTSGTVTSQTLQQTFNTQIGGSPLTKIDSIQASTFALRIFGNGATQATSTGILNLSLTGSNSSVGNAYTQAGLFSNTQTSSGINGNIGLTGSATGNNLVNIGIEGRSLSGSGYRIGSLSLGADVGIVGMAGSLNPTASALLFPALHLTNAGALFVGISPDNDTASSVRILGVSTSGTASNNIGTNLEFALAENGITAVPTNKIISRLINVTSTSEVSQLTFTALFSGAEVNVLKLNGDNSIQLTPITATAASAITPAEGMMIFVSNTNGTFTSIGFWGYQNGAWHAF